MRQPPVFITDRDDNGKLFGHLVAVTNDGVYGVELPSYLVVLSTDGERYQAQEEE